MLPVQHVTIALFISYLFIIGSAEQNVTPRARSAAGAWSTPDGRLWLFGGQAFVNNTYMPLLNDLWRFSADTSAWDWISGSNSPWAPTVPGTMGVPSASSDPGARYFSASWADFRGDLWLFGASGYYNDLWRFRPSTNKWTWMDGSTQPNVVGVYNTPTIPDDTSYPGSRSNTAYAANPNGTLFYTFGGAGYNQVASSFALPDLWRFNVETNQWTWLSGNSTGTNLGNNGTLGEASGGIPAGRKDAHLWASDNNLWLFGGYSQLVNFAITLNDLWHFDLSNYTWTWLGGYSGAGVYGQLGVASVSNWPGSRVGATYWTLGTDLYLFGGEGYGQTVGSTEVLNDLWTYDTTTGMWTWLHGSKITKQTGSYDAGDSQYPGARKYASGWISRTNGLLYLFGGTGYASVQQSGNLNDLWVFNTSSNRWLWLTGSNVVNQVGDFCPSDAEINPVTLQGCSLLCGNNRTDSGEECQIGPGCVQCRCQSPYVIGDPSQSCTLCGNNQLDENEQCDGSSNCQNCTCIEGTVSVSGKCSTCGNGVIDSGEECDGGTGCLSTCICDASQYYEAFNPATAYCNKNEGAPWQIAVAVVVPSVVLIAGGFLGAFFYVKKLRRKHKKAFDNTYIEMANSFLNLPTALYIPFSTITIQERIGEGSYGNVHIGLWNGTRVALKSPKKEYTSQFLEELRVMARIKPHDNLVRLYGYTIRDNETLYVVMEYCAQSSLDKLLYDTDQPISPDQKLLWIKQIAAGLYHLHENQVIHRDIAARNILMSDNVAKLSDFGMSREVTMDKGMTKSEVGPLRWMAPESIRDRVYSTKTDVWMFGCCAYEILVQHEPHTNTDPIQVAIKIQNESLTPELPDTVDQNMAALLRVCWSPSPNDRPSMADVVAHLR